MAFQAARGRFPGGRSGFPQKSQEAGTRTQPTNRGRASSGWLAAGLGDVCYDGNSATNEKDRWF